MAYSNQEYMSLSELNEILLKYKLDLLQKTSSTHSTPVSSKTNSMKRRPVPLPPPPAHIPAPPRTPPLILNRPKIYQNIDHFSTQSRDELNSIHVDCNVFKTPRCSNETTTTTTNNLLMTANQNNSLIYLLNSQNNNSTTSDSSSATMIVKKSPPNNYKSSISSLDDELCDEVNDDLLDLKPVKYIGSLSPIMTSSRADLNQPRLNVIDDRLANRTHQPDHASFKFVTNSLPCNRTRNFNLNRLSYSNENETTLVNNQNNTIKKSFSNYNYELVEHDMVETESNVSSSVDSLILMPPSPFKTEPNCVSANNNHNKSSMKSEPAKHQAKKVSFLIRETHHARSIEQLYYDEYLVDDEEFLICATTTGEEDNLNHLRRTRRNSLSSGSSSSCSTNSSINTVSTNSKIIFTNNHYFISASKQQESSSASSSSSSIPVCSSCSSTSSSSSGYKSNQSASIQQTNTKYVLGPNELDQFIKISRDRLERLKQKRTQIIENPNSKLMSNDDEFVRVATIERTSRETNKKSGLNYVDSLSIKNVSAKLFQKLLSSKQNSPCSTLPRRSK